MSWTVNRTDTFLESLSDVVKNKQVLKELQKKIDRLREDPLHLGKWLKGDLHGKKSTRLAQKYRLIFTPVKRKNVVYLNWIDHREDVY
jgi:mRNA-degrading endonuclease RelE of RelBE toxin-antitoxin system